MADPGCGARLDLVDHRSLANRNRFTVETIRMSDGEPIVLRDNQRPNVVLIRTADGSLTAGPAGQPTPAFKPEE